MWSIGEFKGKYPGADVWVVGSGKTMDYVPPDFFCNKIAVGLNLACLRFSNLDYHIVHHYSDLKAVVGSGTTAPIITSKTDEGFSMYPPPNSDKPVPTIEQWVNWKPYLQNVTNLYYHDHELRSNEKPSSLDPPSPYMLAIGTTVTTQGLSFAAYLGAKSIILCGIDGGGLDAEQNLNGYPAPVLPAMGYAVFEEEILELATLLRRRGVNVVSLNPFISLRLEGHKFK